jgi:hypothetical protein
VHDALDRDASQRPAAKRDVEALAREIERLRVVDGEPDPLALRARQRAARRRHDAWVVGDEPVLRFEFDSRTAEEYARG